MVPTSEMGRCSRPMADRAKNPNQIKVEDRMPATYYDSMRWANGRVFMSSRGDCGRRAPVDVIEAEVRIEHSE